MGVGIRVFENILRCRARCMSTESSASSVISLKHLQRFSLGGSKLKKELCGQDRELTINGFLVPERISADDEFVLYDWEDSTKLYGVANSLMSEYYGDILPSEVGCERQLTGGGTLAMALTWSCGPFLS